LFLVQYHDIKITPCHLRADNRLSTKCGTTPLICPSSLALAIIRVHMSTTILKILGTMDQLADGLFMFGNKGLFGHQP